MFHPIDANHFGRESPFLERIGEHVKIVDNVHPRQIESINAEPVPLAFRLPRRQVPISSCRSPALSSRSIHFQEPPCSRYSDQFREPLLLPPSLRNLNLQRKTDVTIGAKRTGLATRGTLPRPSALKSHSRFLQRGFLQFLSRLSSRTSVIPRIIAVPTSMTNSAAIVTTAQPTAPWRGDGIQITQEGNCNPSRFRTEI